MENKEFPSGTYLIHAKKESASDCQMFCQQTANCSKFVYVKDTYDGVQGHSARKICLLRDGSSMDVIDADNVVAGPKLCPSRIVALFSGP